MKALQKELEYYLENYEDNADKDIENTLHLIKSWINFYLTDDLVSSYNLVLPMLTNLEFGARIESTKSNYSRVLLVDCIFVCRDYKQAFEILQIIEKSLESYPSISHVKEKLLMCAYANYTEMLLNTKYFAEISKEEELEIEKIFFEYSIKVKELSEQTLLHNIGFIMMLREGYFKNKTAFKASREITRNKLRTDEEKELELAITKTNSKKDLIDLVSETPEFKKRIGLKIRAERLARNMSISELAGKADIKESFLESVERGDRGITIEKLVLFADIFGITANDIIYSVDKLT